MSAKPRPNHQRTLRVLRSLSPAQKLSQVFALNKRVLDLAREGLRQRHPEADPEQIERMLLTLRERWHKTNS